MSISINCSIDLTEEELFQILLRRHGGVIKHPTISTGPEPSTDSTGLEGLGNIGRGPIDRERAEIEQKATGIIPEERIEAVETVIAAALPPKPARSRAKANGAAAAAQEAGGTSGVNAPAGQQAMQGFDATLLFPSPPPPEPLDEPAMRSLLSKVGAVHPLKVKAITNLLEAHGGRRRLSECDPSTWPAIATAANATLVEYGV